MNERTQEKQKESLESAQHSGKNQWIISKTFANEIQLLTQSCQCSESKWKTAMHESFSLTLFFFHTHGLSERVGRRKGIEEIENME